MTVPLLAFGLADVSLTVLVIGSLALAGATVVITAVPNWKLPRWRHKPADDTSTIVLTPVVTQRRVVTGRAPVLPPVGTPLPRQRHALPDGRRRPTSTDVRRAEAIIDRYLETDPELLAATLSTWMANDDRPRSRTR